MHLLLIPALPTVDRFCSSFRCIEPSGAEVVAVGWQLVCRRDVSMLHRGRAAADKLPPYGFRAERKLDLSENHGR